MIPDVIEVGCNGLFLLFFVLLVDLIVLLSNVLDELNDGFVVEVEDAVLNPLFVAKLEVVAQEVLEQL